jgi:hypothetical protein
MARQTQKLQTVAVVKTSRRARPQLEWRLGVDSEACPKSRWLAAADLLPRCSMPGGEGRILVSVFSAAGSVIERDAGRAR